MYSLARIKEIEKEKPRKSACFRGFLARHAGFEPAASRLGAIGKPFILGHFSVILIGFTTIYTYLWGFFAFHCVCEK